MKTIPCELCGAMFVKDGKRAKYCLECRPYMRKQYKKDFHDRNPLYKINYERAYRKWLKEEEDE